MFTSRPANSRGSSEAHKRLVKDVLIALGGLPLIRIWKQETGMAYRDGEAIHYGIVGGGDISGILINGKRVEIECKTGQATQRKSQIHFSAMIRKYGGHYVVVRSVQDALDFYHGATTGLQPGKE